MKTKTKVIWFFLFLLSCSGLMILAKIGLFPPPLSYPIIEKIMNVIFWVYAIVVPIIAILGIIFAKKIAQWEDKLNGK